MNETYKLYNRDNQIEYKSSIKLFAAYQKKEKPTKKYLCGNTFIGIKENNETSYITKMLVAIFLIRQSR